MGMGLRIIGGDSGDALSLDSGSVLVKSFNPGSPYTLLMDPTTTATADNPARYWTSASGCRGFRLEAWTASTTWTPTEAFLACIWSPNANYSHVDALSAFAAAIGTPAGTAHANCLAITNLPERVNYPLEVWTKGDDRIKTIALRAHANIKAKLEIWV